MPIPAPFFQQGIDQPIYDCSLYGRTVYGSAWPSIPTQLVGWAEFYQSIVNYLDSKNIVGPGSTFFAIDPDSDIKWPSSPPPFLMVVPRPKSNVGTDEGGGRFAQLITVKLDILIVTGSGYDVAFQDTAVVTSSSLTFGPYALESLVMDKFVQAYVTTSSGNYSMVEFPRYTGTGDLRRFEKTSQYVALPLSFEMTVELNLPSTWYPTALIPDAADLLAFPA